MAITAVKVRATPNQLVYFIDATAGGGEAVTISFSTLKTDAATVTNGNPGPLLAALQACGGEATSDARAVSALLSGEAFTGGSGATIRTDIQTHFVHTVAASAKAPNAISATDDGATNNPQLVVTADGIGKGFLFITKNHSFLQ